MIAQAWRHFVVPKPLFKPIAAAVKIALIGSVIDTRNREYLVRPLSDRLCDREDGDSHVKRVGTGCQMEETHFPLIADVSAMPGTTVKHEKGHVAAIPGAAGLGTNQIVVHLAPAHACLLKTPEVDALIRLKAQRAGCDISAINHLPARLVLDGHPVLHRPRAWAGCPDGLQFQSRHRAGKTQRDLIPVAFVFARPHISPVWSLVGVPCLHVGSNHSNASLAGQRNFGCRRRPVPVLGRVLEAFHVNPVVGHRYFKTGVVG